MHLNTIKAGLFNVIIFYSLNHEKENFIYI